MKQKFLKYSKRAFTEVLRENLLINRLKESNFDLAFSHMYDFCPIGLIYAAKIPTWIWLNSGQIMDITAQYMGVPSPPSYVPRKFFL